MNFIGMLILAVGLSMDAFAVAVCKGFGLAKVRFRDALIVGLYFGIFQAVMPLIGYFMAIHFAGILSFDHWIAFAILSVLGVRMVIGGLRGQEGGIATDGTRLGPKQMLPLAVATSIDALAVGVSFAFIDVNIFHAILIIGVTTLILSMIGVRMGRTFGERIGTKAEMLGGVILVLIGLRILFDGLGII
jgi:putative Mn2+ efflux pump MntP